jgi:hypothetical protein
MTADLNERTRALEVAVASAAEEIKGLRTDVSALKRFQVSIMTALTVVGVALTYFGETLRKKFGF